MSDHAAVKAKEVVDRLENQLFGSGLDRVKVEHEIAAAIQDERLKEAEWSQQMFHRLPWSLDASLAKRIEKELRERIEKLKRGEL